MPGNLSNLINIQAQLSQLQLNINDLNAAVAQQGGAVISTTTIQSDLNSLVATINTAVATQTNNTINGNQ